MRYTHGLEARDTSDAFFPHLNDMPRSLPILNELPDASDAPRPHVSPANRVINFLRDTAEEVRNNFPNAYPRPTPVPQPSNPDDLKKVMGFFTDTTLCIGCKACEVACKQWNQLPAD